MKFTERPYQTEAADLGAEYLLSKRKKNGVIVMPTGAGKSILIAGIAARLNAPLLVLQPQKEILEQNYSKFLPYGYKPAIFSASMGKKQIGDITLATIGSIVKHPELFVDFQHLLMDECHLANPKEGMYREFFQEGKFKVLGLTATPYRLAHSTRPMPSGDKLTFAELRFLTRQTPRVFSDMVYVKQIGDLVKEGFLSKLEYYQIQGFKRARVEVNSQGSDYKQDSLQLHLWEKNWSVAGKKDKKLNFADKLVEVVTRVMAAGRKHILVFTASIAESERLAVSIGTDCAIVTGETPKAEREDILNGFKAGRIRVVTNAAVLVHGFDFPELDCMIDAAPSLSLSRYYQKIGRPLRAHPEKESAWVIDMAETYALYGRVEDLTLYCKGDREWALWGRPGGPDRAEEQLTNVPIAGRMVKLQFCRNCTGSDAFWARHEKTNKPALLSRALNGTKPYLAVWTKEGTKGKVYVKRSGDAEYVYHRDICKGK